MKKIYILTILILIIGQLFSFSLLERNFGNIIWNNDARAAGMANTGVVGGYRLFDLNLNPANLSLQKNKLGAQLGVNLIEDNESRALPIFNFFDSYTADATYSSNINIYDHYSFASFYKFSFKNLNLATALSYRPYVDYNANYTEEVRNDASSNLGTYPPIIAKNYINCEGLLSQISFTNSCNYDFNKNFIQTFSFGFSASYLIGDSKDIKRIEWTDSALELVNPDTLQNSYHKSKKNYSGFKVDFGFTAQLSQRFSLGLSFTPKTTLSVDGNFDGLKTNNDEYLPSRINLGIKYLPRNIMKTVFNAEINFTSWSDVNTMYNNTVSYAIGLEHLLYYSLPLRLGFRYDTVNYLSTYENSENESVTSNNEINIPTFTAGTGFNITDNMTLDISVQYSNRSYDALDLFPDGYYNHANLWNYIQPTNRGWENPDSVTENFVKLFTSLNYKW
jgi:opacity protein-like surface antigen